MVDKDSINDKNKIREDVKILVTKRKEVMDEEDEQEVVIEALKNCQDLVEYWIFSKLVEGIKDIVDKEKVLTDVTKYND